MKRFVVYDSTTGKINRMGSCAEDALEIQALYPDEAVIEGSADPLTHYVWGGEIRSRPPAPAPWMTFVAATETWADLRTPEQVAADLVPVKDAARRELVAALDRIGTEISGLVPRAEELSWPSKEVAAQAWQAGTASQLQVSMLQAEASQTGETLAELVAAILSRSGAFYAASGAIAGLRRTTIAAVTAAVEEAAVETAKANGLAEINTFAAALFAASAAS